MVDMSKAAAGDSPESELVALFREADDPVLTAVEVGDELGITQQAAHAKLSRAHEEGVVERKKTGSRSVVWWIEGYCFTSE